MCAHIRDLLLLLLLKGLRFENFFMSFLSVIKFTRNEKIFMVWSVDIGFVGMVTVPLKQVQIIFKKVFSHWTAFETKTYA